jgi:hypothetical protein
MKHLAEREREEAHRPRRPRRQLPDLFLGSDGRLFANLVMIPTKRRHGRRVARVVELTTREADHVLRQLVETAPNFLVGLPNPRKS